jgi:hypothetical protein
MTPSINGYSRTDYSKINTFLGSLHKERGKHHPCREPQQKSSTLSKVADHAATYPAYPVTPAAGSKPKCINGTLIWIPPKISSRWERTWQWWQGTATAPGAKETAKKWIKVILLILIAAACLTGITFIPTATVAMVIVAKAIEMIISMILMAYLGQRIYQAMQPPINWGSLQQMAAQQGSQP